MLIQEQEVSNMKAQLSQCFLPDEEYPLGAPPCPQMELQPIHQVIFFIIQL